jgi:F-type H+-transporting ATPase subunit epsilon
MLFSGEAEYVAVPAAEGEIGFLYKCAPFMSTLKRGTVRIKEVMAAEAAQVFAVDGGYVEVDGYKVVVLASHALDVKDVDVAVAQERIATNEKRLAELDADDSRAVFIRQEIEWQQFLVTLIENKSA